MVYAGFSNLNRSFLVKSKVTVSFYRSFSSLVLGIETSCDDSSVAIIDYPNRIIKGYVTLSQIEVHRKTHGIVPLIAGIQHTINLPNAIQQLMAQSNVLPGEIKLIGVTRGPGLAPSLLVGLNAAKSIASLLNVPLIGVHHMAGHALISTLLFSQIKFPFISLLVSGGHTLLLIVEGVEDFIIVGSTLDDSIGEALDKGCKYLRIPWNSFGPAAALEEVALRGNEERFPFPIPFQQKDPKDNYNMSFSGLKTALQRLIQCEIKTDDNKEDISQPSATAATSSIVSDLAASYQKACFRHVLVRLEKFLKNSPLIEKIEQIVVSGGVASNEYFRVKLQHLVDKYKKSLIIPPSSLCTDNAVMIGWVAAERYYNESSKRKGKKDDYSIDILPKWPINCIKDY